MKQDIASKREALIQRIMNIDNETFAKLIEAYNMMQQGKSDEEIKAYFANK